MSDEAAVWVPLAELKPWVKNPRKNDHAVEGVAASLRRFGWGRPLVVGYGEWGESLLAGHTTLKAAIYLDRAVPGMVIRGAPGPRVAPVRRQAFATEAEAHAYALADNKTAEASEWDEAMLGDVVRELSEAGASIDDLGWDAAEVAEMLGGQPEGSGAEDQTGDLHETFQVLVLCKGEGDQADLLQELKDRGFDVRSLIT